MQKAVEKVLELKKRVKELEEENDLLKRSNSKKEIKQLTTFDRDGY